MALNPNINTREFDKFTQDGGGNTAVRVVGSISTSSSLIEQILNASDKSEAYVWLDWNSRKLRRISTITYTALSVSLTAYVLETYTYTLNAGEYRLDDITRTYAP